MPRNQRLERTAATRPLNRDVGRAETAMNRETDQEVLDTLREIREGQREIIRLLAVHNSATEEQVKRSKETLAESVALQKLALQRQRTVTLIAFPGILACLAAIVYLVLKYF
jgi:hypothetical protein